MARQISATLFRSTGPRKPREPVWTRKYAWMDTAMPRAVQIPLREGEVGDLIEFSGEQAGFQLGTIELGEKCTLKVEWSPLVQAHSGLMKLMGSYL